MATCFARPFAIFCMGLTLSSVATAAEATGSADSLVGHRVEELFQFAVPSNPQALQNCRRVYESLSSDEIASPRVDYAYGLVLLKLMKPKQAQQQFLIAARRPGAVYRPAWQTLIWLNFNSREYAEGYDLLIEYTKVILDPAKLSPELQGDEIYWIGRVMSALDLTLNSIASRESWIQTDDHLRQLLGSERIRLYNDGKQDLQVCHELIEEKIQNNREKLEHQRAVKREKDLKRKAALLESAGENSEKLKKSAREASQSLQEQTAVFQKQMQRAEKDLTFLERRAMLLTGEILVLDQQINALENTPRNSNATVNQSNAERLNALQNQRVLKDLEFQRISAVAQQISSNTQHLTMQREGMLDQNERETGERAEQNRLNEKVRLRTLRELAELQQTEAASKVSGGGSKPIAARTLRTYIDWDLTVERDKLLASYGIKSGKK